MIGELVPLALGIALSPAPLLAVGVMLLADRATRAALGLLAGWFVSIGVLTAAATALAGGVSPSSSAARASYAVQLGFGVALLIIAARQWRIRPKRETASTLPGWISSAASFGPRRAAALGVILVVANPKVVPLCLAAGRTIGQDASAAAGQAWTVCAFTVAAACTVIAPTVAQLTVGPKMQPALLKLQAWLIRRHTPVVVTTLIVVGVLLIATGAQGLS